MKFVTLFTIVIIGCVCAEQPRYRRRKQFARQELATPDQTEASGDQAPYAAAGVRPGRKLELPQDEESTTLSDEGTTQTASGPYSPSGWKPSGRLLVLPFARQEIATTYGPPSTEYGAPDDSTSQLPSDDSESTTLVDPDSEIVEDVPVGVGEPEILDEPTNEVQQGAYFIQLPNGSLQRVVYVSASDPTGLAGTANLQVQPVIQVSPTATRQLLLAPPFVSYSSQYKSW